MINAKIDGGNGNDHLTGGGGHDTILGGPGHDRLSGGGGHDMLLAGEGNDDLNGGDGKDVLVGGAGDDKLDGGKAPDVLIGGSGKDEMKGSQDDDLLIAGSTSYDEHVTSLNLIVAEWSSGRDYTERVNNLRAGTGQVLNGMGVKLKASGSGRTVFDDDSKDTLQGDGGRDWFFADLDGQNGDDDKVKDKKSNEQLDMI